MTIKNRFKHRDLSEAETPKLNENLDVLYSHKLESKHLQTSSGTTAYTYQAMEHGLFDFSATGSPTVARSFELSERHGKIVYATAHAKSTLVTAHVTDVTNTSITVECRTVSGTANFSGVTTAAVPVYWQVIGSSP